MNTHRILWYKACFLFFVSFAVVACSAHYGNEPKEDKKPDDKTETSAYLQLSVDCPKGVTLRGVKRDPMTEVRQLFLLFYDVNSETLRYVRDAGSITEDGLSKIDVRLPSGDYLLVALANPTEALRSSMNRGASLSLLTEGQALKTKTLLGDDLSLVMANEQGVVNISKSDFGESRPLAAQSPIHIRIEPVLARVFVYGTPTIYGGSRGEAEPKYIVNNGLKKTSVLRMLNKLSTGVMERQGDNSNRAERYAKSVYWDQWEKELPQNTAEITVYYEEDLQAKKMGARVREKVSDFDAELSTNKFIYAKENVLPENAFRLGFVPHVLIAFPYIPNDVKLSSGEGWLSFRGRHYAEHTIREMIENPDNAPEDLRAVLEDSKITVQKLEESTGGFSIGGLDFFYKGYSYYVVPIRHFGGDPELASYGFYGIVRGNEYRLQLLDISQVGSPVPICYKNNLDPIYSDKHLTAEPLLSLPINRDQEVHL